MELQTYEKEHLDRVITSASECTLFLNTNGKFPLKEAGKIAAYGSGVRKTVKGGTGSGEVNSRFSVNIETGLKEAGFEITTEAWMSAYEKVFAEAEAKFVKDMKAEAKAAHQNAMMYAMGKECPEPNYNLPLDGEGDVAIYVVARNSGEGNDRKAIAGDIKLTDTEVRDILACEKKYDKFMVVLNVGGVVDLSPIKEVGNILVLSQLGVVTGTVLANILLGKANPSGKLATTWSAWNDYSDKGTFGDWDDSLYKEGVYVGYRYFDSVGKKALFPFGYGKSYTSFEISDCDVTIDGSKVKASTKVTNTGSCAGKEVVEVYLSAPQGELDKPYQDLAAFVKTSVLAPGSVETVEASFDLVDMASYSEERASYILEKGNYLVRIGNSSVATKVACVISLDETVETLKAKNVLGKPEFSDFVPEERAAESIPSDVKIIAINSASLKSEAVKYDVDYPVDDVISKLTDEELAYMNVGGFDPNAKGLAIIGNAASHVAGAAGESTSMLTSKGIKAMIMADGPAGLRLAKQFYRDEKGAHGCGVGMLPESMEKYLTGITGFIIKKIGGAKKPPKNATIEYQYATAIPIGTAIAQSFNYDLAKDYGDIVGDEMERFGVHLWLAPALNIHRDIRCGRNFEYYSEDPLVSGLMAAAITEGVQKHEGCGTTIKHYAANNAETNRYNNNSQVSERAMREIYLKGFGICVKKSQPHAVMTSYNLLNGTHTSEHRGLIEEILRNEYDYQGIVMTDWVIAMMSSAGCKYRGALSNEVAKAGGDVFMPGSKGDYDHVLSALKDGSLPRKQVEINATRMYRMAEQLVK